MKIAVVGAGYVGLVTATCLAELGNDVICVDRDHGRVAVLQAGGVPIFEPGLEDLLQRNCNAERLRFTTSIAVAVRHAEVIFIAVGTPPQEDGSADLQHVLAVAAQIGQHMTDFKVVVNKSTVPVGTGGRVEQVLRSALAARGLDALDFAVVSNPEFLKEGAALDDFMRPDRIVIGLPPGEAGEAARRLMTRLYAPFNRHHERSLWMDVASAEMTKYAANAMLATRISFMNEMAHLADALGADIDSVRRGIGSDSRIGHGFLYAGTGYGGSCFPKDTRALIHEAAAHGLRMRVVEATESVNHEQKQVLVDRVCAHFGSDLRGLRLGVWGLAFKPNTDDMRDAPSRIVIPELLSLGAEVLVHDPVASSEAQRALSADLGRPVGEMDGLKFVDSPLEAVADVDALLVLTEWKCFHNPDFDAMARSMRGRVIFDGRNLYDPALMDALGFVYQGIGRRGLLKPAQPSDARPPCGATHPQPGARSAPSLA
ncbi:UDP-glucose/GDP-mannose dehydrogenase family protein [Hydrogenophaga sp.]|uniref:UDP-glucose dehydrogenase family protein n=1 Tax=Hydrogenophaga sp. TaxID=1904254 RepID=UPI0025BECA44|nr:UDP-glucose/GDP-mannose dehydrogenase family protein [Hydrogenophaga sp.]MBT9465345.1 UDP-glucose/GDP-mannose dehydrogenase family protein [Hydrogenophaga sp.]